MIASIRELEKVKNEYYRWYVSGDRDSQERAAAIAAENFSWVLETAVQLAERQANDS